MTTASNLHPNTDIQNVPMIGDALTKAFNSIGVFTVVDLLYFFPTRYMDYRKTIGIGLAQEGETVTVIGRVKSIRANYAFRGRAAYAEATIEDGTGKIKAVWFNQSYIAKQVSVGTDIILSGKVSRYKQLQFSNPAYELIDPETANSNYLHTGRLVPIYKRGDIVPLRTMRKLVRTCLLAATELDDYIPQRLQRLENVLSVSEAVRLLHFPETEEHVQEARLRIAIDDVLPQQIAVQLKKDANSGAKGFKISADINLVKSFLKTLPFELTPSQKRAIWDIFKDFEVGSPMNRLLQGDVGSGKTIVAILSTLQIANAGGQSALLAPTEILAKQHYETFRSLLKNQKRCDVALLTRTFALINGEVTTKQDLLKKIADGSITICIGTHALLQGKSEFKNLALVIIDEQHRFGVGQRSFLLSKENSKLSRLPHLLSMSATPIPRTLAMSLYADLSVSTLSHVPTGRKSIITTIVPEIDRHKAYNFIRAEVEKGFQAFVVTPRVEDTNTSEVRSVKKEFTRLQTEIFPKLRLGLLYGKMKGSDKDKVMADFAQGKLDILVATSVIEIGIDIPKATAMIIEGSERFGLAQLHQLRGRIGRNEFESHCFLFTTEESHQETARLSALANTNDGFALAELDLEQRGFGDLFGKQQSGFMFRFPQFITVTALKAAQALALQIHVHGFKKDRNKTLYKQAKQYLEEMHNE